LNVLLESTPIPLGSVTQKDYLGRAGDLLGKDWAGVQTGFNFRSDHENPPISRVGHGVFHA
jgi:hypothetical protein